MVTIPKFLPVIMRPGIGDYDNPYVLRTTPCEVVDGRYRDLRTGAVVEKKNNMLEWRNLSGTVFRFEHRRGFSNENLLISRRFEDGRLLLLSLEDREITPMMVVRTMRTRHLDDD